MSEGRYPGWFWAGFTPLGLGAWAPLVPALRLKRRSWALLAALWSVIAVAGWTLAAVNDGGAAGGLLILLGWAGGVVTCTAIRPTYLDQVGSSWDVAKREAQQRLMQRDEALRMAEDEPALARELGVGRPDVDPDRAGGVVDLNHAAYSALRTLPGVDAAVAERIVEVREEINGFESLADFGGVLGLDGNAVERLRGLVVFLPR